ncbi:MAG: efflux RND transporter periplasmic adaptor subunit [Campylobacterales bacterium]|nr:efflux RND transporter periplasmic adaptor subunit [Campylobacterales bacterium]
MDELEKNLGLNKKAKSSYKKWLILVLVLMIVAGVYYFKFLPKDKEISYITQEAKLRDIDITVLAAGNLEPTNSVNVGIEVSGTISELYVDFNDYVKKNQLLAKIDTTKIESRVRNSEAALRVADANLKNSEVALSDAKIELDRAENLFKATKGKFPSTKEIDSLKSIYERAKADFESKKALVVQAKASLEANEDDLKKAIVRSPLDGVILDKKVEVGQSVVASMQIPVLFVIAEDLKKMELSLSVDEADIGSVEKGQKVKFSVDAYPKKEFEGVITKVHFNSQIVDSIVTYSAIVSLSNDELLLRPGMTATAQIYTKSYKDVLSIQNSALRFNPKLQEDKKGSFGKKPTEPHQSKVWVLKDNKPQAIEIKTAQSDSKYTIVLDGLDKDAKVITGTKDVQR